MRTLFTLGLVIFFGISTNLLAQSEHQSSNSFLENIPDSTIFQSYLDSIDKYLYSDFVKMGKYINECERLLEKGIPLTSQKKRSFVKLNILYERNLNKYLKAYQILEDNRNFIYAEEVLEKDKKEFQLQEGYILYSLGEIESAQKIYQDIIEWSQKNNSPHSYATGLYYLAQIQSSQENYIDAEKNFLKLRKIEKAKPLQSAEHLVTIYELSNLYLSSKDYDKAEHFNSLGLSMAQEMKNSIFIFEFQNFMALLAIQKKQFIKAQNLIRKTKILSDELASNRYIESQLLTSSEFQISQNQYKKALETFEHLLAIDSKETPSHTIHLYEKVHDLYAKIGNHKNAYKYLLKMKTTQDSIYNQKKIQQVYFLNTKFKSEQSEKSNQLLTSQVLQKQTQNKFLYALASLCILIIIGLFGAFYQKQKYNSVLQQEIDNQTKELQNANSQLFQSNEELAQFNNILSHDLKEPLRSIVGFCSIAKRKLKPDHEVIQYLKYIEKGGKQLFNLIDDVSTFNRVDRLDPKEFVETDLNELIKSISDSIYSLKNEKDIRLIYANFPTIYSNKTILFLILKNLIENGIKYNKSKPAIVNIIYKEEDQDHILLVQDNGIGISEEFQSSIFGMFKRLHNRGKYSGSGLGLSIVKKIIQKMDGNVSLISSQVNQGSIFEVRFPIVNNSSSISIDSLHKIK